ncbi:U-box domain-containing protein 45-like [Phragmites australis]|uniref:U-box domain-containing protein 45-like n=1 Tax=Phragmites australis TaxID=29695 RepID=UPI002D784F7D|nr:U-box domain-containing protein 45-like [Phragmites australis]
MDAMEAEEGPFLANDAKLHTGMCRAFHPAVSKLSAIFPFIEASRPRSKSGIQALCSLHVALDKAKGLLQHCADCSRLYLAITAETVLLKFEKARSQLQESLRRVESIVTEDIGCKIVEIIGELEEIAFTLDQSEKEAGDEVINLLQRNNKINGSSDSGELEVFHMAALKLGITSSRAALTERRALKKLIEKARSDEDKRKEFVVSYLYNLMRKYSKFFRSEAGDDTDSQGSSPCSPTVLGMDDMYGSCGNGRAFSRQLSNIQLFNSRFGSFNSRLGSFNCRLGGPKSENMSIPPEELRCPISLQLMYDPVIISSGQTYERVCIEKWFNDGHSTCPKTQQQLAHLCLTPNYCVKALIASWCEQNNFPVPDGPPGSFGVNWRLAFSDSEATGCVSTESFDSTSVKGVKVVPMENVRKEEPANSESGTMDDNSCYDLDINEGYGNLLLLLHGRSSMHKKCRLVEQIRYLLKDDEEARIQMGSNGFAEALVEFLRNAVNDGNEKAQVIGAMALFNLAVNNNRNKGLLLSAGVVELLEQMVSNPRLSGPVTALYLNISCLPDAKNVIGSSQAVSFLVDHLYSHEAGDTKGGSCKSDALYTLYNLSTHQASVPALLSAGIVDALHCLLTESPACEGLGWTEKALAVLISLAATQAGRKEIMSTPGLVSTLATLLDTGEAMEQEQAVSCLLVMCTADDKCIAPVLQEGVVPSLVSISAAGTGRGREKAQKLLKLFREQRQREAPPQQPQQQLAETGNGGAIVCHRESKPLCKSKSRKLGRALSSLWKNRGFSLYQC